MIFKDKQINQKIEYLYSLIMALGRIQKIHPTILHEESRETVKNLQYMVDMVKKGKKGATQ